MTERIQRWGGGEEVVDYIVGCMHRIFCPKLTGHLGLGGGCGLGTPVVS